MYSKLQLMVSQSHSIPHCVRKLAPLYLRYTHKMISGKRCRVAAGAVQLWLREDDAVLQRKVIHGETIKERILGLWLRRSAERLLNGLLGGPPRAWAGCVAVEVSTFERAVIKTPAHKHCPGLFLSKLHGHVLSRPLGGAVAEESEAGGARQVRWTGGEGEGAGGVMMHSQLRWEIMIYNLWFAAGPVSGKMTPKRKSEVRPGIIAKKLHLRHFLPPATPSLVYSV